jgi:hypothetical protein
MFQLFLNGDDLDSGLYEGEVRGRRLFGGSQVPLFLLFSGTIKNYEKPRFFASFGFGSIPSISR